MDAPSLQSAPASKFGVLKKVDLRILWPNEAFDFTPWLRDNLETLGEVVGMDLEFLAQESPVGPFSLDLLTRDVGTDRVVVIENQIEQTDHDHLGKLLTYAAGHNAAVAIWITAGFREEHRQALDWLNQRTNTDTEFFGVVVEALQIDNSRPACNLRLVSFPNNWQKTTAKSKGTATPKEEAYLEFFQELIDRLRVDHKFTKATKGQAQSWYAFSSGRTGVGYVMTFTAGGKARTEVYIDRGEQKWNKWAFDQFEEHRSAIEHQFGEPLQWERMDTKQSCRIAIYRDAAILGPDFDKDEVLAWAIDHLLRLKAAFGSRIMMLPVSVPAVEIPASESPALE